MTDGATPILPVPLDEVTRRRTRHVARDLMRGWDVAGPLFDAGCIKVALAKLPEYQGSLHRSHTHWFHLVVQGRMEFQLGQDTFVVGPGELVCVPAGVLTRARGLGPIVWIYIEVEDVPLWYPLKKLGPSVRKYESTDLMYILASRIIDARLNQDVYSVQCAVENAEMFLKLLKRELRQSTNEWTTSHMHRLVHLLDRIRKHPGHAWDRARMAKEANMSERNLSRVFQRVFGTPPARMVMTVRMDLATQMLSRTDMSLAEIASAVGYQSAFSFSRLFKKCVGVSPGHYRKTHPQGQ